jgi:hypothetical protein
MTKQITWLNLSGLIISVVLSACQFGFGYRESVATTGLNPTTPTTLFTTTTEPALETAIPTFSTTPRTPIAVAASSYENAKSLNLVPQKLPIDPYSGVAHAFADFKRNGELQLFEATIEYDVNDPTTFSNKGHFWFYTQAADGSFIRDTTLLIDDIGCLHPRKAIVADFNNDSRPDLMVGCTGIDTGTFPGEQSAIILSQSTGIYRTAFLPFTAYAHGLAAADVNRDGYPDVLMTDTSVAQMPFLLINNRDGTFTRRFDLLPVDLKGKLFYTAEFIDFNQDGLPDVFLAGHNWVDNGTCSCTSDPIILINDGSGKFIQATRITLPSVPNEGVTLDILFLHNNIYLLHTSGGDGTFYQSTVIQKIAYPGLISSVIYSTRQPFVSKYSADTPYGGSFPWTPWITLYQGKIVSTSNVFTFAVEP